MNCDLYRDYELGAFQAVKSNKLKMINKKGDNLLRFNLEEVQNSSRKSTSSRCKSSCKLFREAKKLPSREIMIGNSRSEKLILPSVRPDKNRKVSFNVGNVESSDKRSSFSRQKSSVGSTKNSIKISIYTEMSEKKPRSEKELKYGRKLLHEEEYYFSP